MSYDASIGSGPYRTPVGTLLNSYGRVVAYVRATAFNDDDANVASLRVASLASALNRVSPGRGDVIVVLPGHTETVSTGTYMAALAAGTQVIGQGEGAARPTFTFDAVASQWLIAAANITFSNLVFNFGGGAAITIAIDVTGANVGFYNCDFTTAASSTSRANVCIRLSTGASGFSFVKNRMRGTITANGNVDGILVNAAVANLLIADNDMVFGTTVPATVGLIRFAAAATRVGIHRNIIYNESAASVECVSVDAAVTGVCSYNSLGTTTGATAPASSGIVGTLTDIRFFENYCSTAGASGILSPAADA